MILAKREKLRKEGKLLSKAQKKSQQQAQLRRQQMLESGVKIEGLAGDSNNNDASKKDSRTNKKKKQQQKISEATDDAKVMDIKEEVKENVDETTKEEIKKPEPESMPEGGVKESWELSDEEEDEEKVVSKDEEKKKEEKAKEEKAKELKAKELKAKELKAKEEKAKVKTKEVKDKKEHVSAKEPSSKASDVAKTVTKPVIEADTQPDRKPTTELGTKHVENPATKPTASKDNLRSPICCILGHVDTGKTKLLDKIRQTNVQEGEAGGITQQIGASYFPMDTIKIKTAPLNKDGKQEYNLPGLLIIDTPGHESFTNLRTRGSSLCNIAILVVDIMHGLEPQTLESLRLLRDRKTPFIVALNKIDRIYGWEAIPDNAFVDSIEKQENHVKREFQDRVQQTIVAFAEQGLNSVLYYENKNFAKLVSLVPTSAITGEGIPDMLMLLVNLTQTRMSNQLMYLSEIECTVLEVKVIDGLGTTIDVILSNGVLNEGDRIVICGLNGPIVTNIRALLTPQPLRELRVKSSYVHHKSVKAAQGVKISAQDLDKAIAGSRLLVVGPDDDEEEVKEEVMSDLQDMMSSVDKSGKGVYVQASTLGSLEALLEFLKTSKIPVSGVGIGPVHRKDVMRAASMLEKAKEFAVILAFDVKFDKEAQDLAEELGIKMFKADIIYHLFDQFTAYNQDMLEQKRRDQAPQAVFPCVLRIIPGAVFNKRDPILVGVDVVEGSLRVGTPICVVKVDAATNVREILNLGRVVSIQQNHKNIDMVRKGQASGGVAVKIECPSYETPKMIGRHFVEQDELYSKISRQSIDVVKESFRDDVSKEDWALIIKLKKILNV
ncbi:6754_t:CDS:10 [Paraglomus brasilianum]|uniref:Translation initiation factor IF-2 n=1 Tax=Paraglomus brasilianum TaxID=144538 RepID=A0A9N9CQ47_9GLOM|nr:6754_t:CDS:10 [Paraglomus brasilianum]